MVKYVDLDGVGVSNGKLWGLPHTPEEAALVVIPVPWEVTVSFKGGTKYGPDAILAASPQIDLYDVEFEDYPPPWQQGMALGSLGEELPRKNDEIRLIAGHLIRQLELGKTLTDPEWLVKYAQIERACEALNEKLYLESLCRLDQGKIVAVLGGDHSTPLGLMRAVSDRFEGIGLLHIDAHLDLRDAYEGFKYSHASIMRNAAEMGFARKFVHVGIRDFCREEHQYITEHGERHSVYTDRNLKHERFVGVPWMLTAQRIVKELPQNVYVSFDIDGLDPSLCPDTGTPVPGGLQFEEAMYLIESVVKSGRKIVGFDLVEVAPTSRETSTWQGDWNANIGMRVLYRLSCLALESQRK